MLIALQLFTSKERESIFQYHVMLEREVVWCKLVTSGGHFAASASTHKIHTSLSWIINSIRSVLFILSHIMINIWRWFCQPNICLWEDMLFSFFTFVELCFSIYRSSKRYLQNEKYLLLQSSLNVWAYSVFGPTGLPAYWQCFCTGTYHVDFMQCAFLACTLSKWPFYPWLSYVGMPNTKKLVSCDWTFWNLTFYSLLFQHRDNSVVSYGGGTPTGTGGGSGSGGGGGDFFGMVFGGSGAALTRSSPPSIIFLIILILYVIANGGVLFCF